MSGPFHVSWSYVDPVFTFLPRPSPISTSHNTFARPIKPQLDLQQAIYVNLALKLAHPMVAGFHYPKTVKKEFCLQLPGPGVFLACSQIKTDVCGVS